MWIRTKLGLGSLNINRIFKFNPNISGTCAPVQVREYTAHAGLDIHKTSTAFLKGKAYSTRFLDKTIWNPRPVIDLLSRAVFELGVSFLHFLGPTLVVV